MDKEAAKELAFLEKVKAHLEEGQLAITLETENEDEDAWLATYNLLTAKPVIYQPTLQKMILRMMEQIMHMYRLCVSMHPNRTARYL